MSADIIDIIEFIEMFVAICLCLDSRVTLYENIKQLMSNDKNYYHGKISYFKLHIEEPKFYQLPNKKKTLSVQNYNEAQNCNYDGNFKFHIQ